MTLAAGSPVEINGSSYVTPALAKSSNRVAVAIYERFDSAWEGVTNVVSTDGVNTTVNSENNVYNNKDIFEIDIEQSTTGKLVAYYQDEADHNAYGGVFTVSGSVATGQADSQVDNNGDIRHPVIGQISASKFVGCHAQSTTTNIAVILTVTGNNVSGGSLFDISDWGAPMACVGVSGSYSAFMRFRSISGTFRPEIVLLDTSGGVPSESDRDHISSTTVSPGGITIPQALVRVDDTRVAMVWEDSTSGEAKVVIADISGGSVSFGSVLTLTGIGDEPILVAPTSDQLVVIGAETGGSGDDARAAVLNVSGTTVTEDPDTITFNVNGWDSPRVAIVASGEMILTSGGYAVTIYGAPTDDTELRYLGIAVDDGRNIYLTKCDGAELFLKSLNPDYSDLNEVSLGAATFTEIDSGSRGATPATEAGGFETVYVFGLDGDDIQVQVSLDGGQTLDDIGDGSWSALARALLININDPLDIVVPFSDGEIYQTKDGGDSWPLVTDTGLGIRRCIRHPIEPLELLLAPASTDSLYYSPNLGESLDDIGDSFGLVNAIEVSRE